MNQLHEWSFVLVSKSPLRIGTDDGDLLLDEDGRPFLPGTSWAGACRAYMLALDPANEALFGSQGSGSVQQGSRLIFSDGVCITPQPFEVRPRVKLDRATRTVGKEKFGQMTVAAGAKFRVKLTLRTDNVKDKERVERMLHALHSGIIRLGAYKSTGGGRMAIEDGRYVGYDFAKREDLEAYVEESKPADEWKPMELDPDGVLCIDIAGELAGPMLIAGQYPLDSNKPDRTPVWSEYDGEPRYIIPATSLKGALRHQTVRIIRAIGADPSLEEHLFEGRIMLEDILLEEPKTKIYHRVAINPLTGGNKDGALLDEETVTGKFTAGLHLRYDDSERDQAAAALVLLALRDLAEGRQTLGSGQGIGRGNVRLSSLRMRYGDRTVEIDFVRRSVHDPYGWMAELQRSLDACVKKEGEAG